MRKLAMLSLMLFIALIFTSACGSGGSSGSCEFTGYPNILGKLTLSKDKFKINKGQTDKITAYVDGKDKTTEAIFTVKSEKEDTTTKKTIANVDKGTITAINAGTAVINVHIDNTEEDKTFTVNVIDPTLPTLEVVKTLINYEIGQDTTDIENIIVTLNGQDVTDKVSFTSTDENVATVDENGKITFIAEGETQVIVHLDGANDQIVTIKVTLPELEINKREITLQVGETEQLSVKLKGEDKTTFGATYQSSNPNIATVDENGKITAVAEGKTEITVKVDGAKEAIISVTVPHQKATLSKDSFNLMLGNSEALPSVTLRGEPVTCQFQSSNENVVTIDENGNIKTVGVGETNITTQCNGDEFTIPIKVYDTLTTNATNSSGQNITVNTKVLAGDEADDMKIILRDTGMIDNENAVQNIVQIDQTDDVADVTIDIDSEDGTKVAVISKNQNGNIDYVSTETVQDKKITVSSVYDKNIYQVAKEDENGQTEMVLTTAGFYKDDELLADWTTCNTWSPNWWTQHAGGYNLMASHSDLLKATKLIIPEGVKTLGGSTNKQLFVHCGYGYLGSKLRIVVLPNSLEEGDIGTPFLSEAFMGFTNINIRSDNPHFESIEGVIYSEDLKTLYLCPTNKTQMRILDTCITINERAFEYNQTTSAGPEGSGADIIIPNSVTTLKTDVFVHEPNIVWIELPSSVKTIHPIFACFDFLHPKFKSMFVPSSVTTINSGDAPSGYKPFGTEGLGKIYYESNGVTREQYREIVAGYNN